MTSASSEPRFRVGQRLVLKVSQEAGVVVDAREVAGEWQYELFLNADATHVYPERFLTEDTTDDSIVAKVKQWQFLEPAEFRQALTTLKLQRPLEQNLYSYLGSRTDLQPYQFKPVLKLLQSPYGRLFIADEVGLGKTIEAGIIMLELAARMALRRVLVVCPPALTRKWQSELFERFDQDFEILNTPRALEIVGDADLAHVPVKAIGSLSLLRGGRFTELLAESEARFDLVVIDESHHMQNPTTAAHRLGEHLSILADHMLMLSATPLSLSAANLFHQLSILVPEEFFDAYEFADRIAPNQHLHQAVRALRTRHADVALAELRQIASMRHAQLFVGNPYYEELCAELAGRGKAKIPVEERFAIQEKIQNLSTIGHVFTRTRKREVQDRFPSRRAAVVKVRLTDPERDFYEAVTAFVRAQSGQMANFAAVMPQRQVASSIPAAREYMRERWGMEVEVEVDAAAELQEDFDDDAPEQIAALDDDSWDDLQSSWRASEGIDSKYEAFLGAIREAIEEGTAIDGKILVFSFFRKTIEYLERRLRDEVIAGDPLRVSILYGGTSQEERHRIVSAFRNDPGPHVVLASEVAAEGLDFEFANVMVNYDLPWNPMRVEQRIGRLDRYGQTARTIHIINFSVEDTIEERILERLYTRIGIFEAAIGDLETILGDEIEVLTKELLRRDLTAEEQARVIDQAAENIVRRKDESESFEQESQALLGQDDVFSDQYDRMKRDRRFVGPDEIRNFVTVALKARYPRARMLRSEDGIVKIAVPGDGALRDMLANYLQRHLDRTGRKAWRAVDRARPGTDWAVTFEPETAKAHRDLDFVTLQHPLVGALLDQEPDAVKPTAALRVISAEREPATYAFFLYLIDVKGFRSGLEFHPVVVHPDRGVDEPLSDALLSLITDSVDPNPSSERLDDGTVVRAWETAESWIVERIAQRETEMRQLSDQIIDRRVASLGDAYGRWVTNTRAKLVHAEEYGQDRIVRMHKGHIRRRDAEHAEKLRKLETERDVLIGHELIAGGILEVTPS